MTTEVRNNNQFLPTDQMLTESSKSQQGSWPVDLYRRKHDGEWERMVPVTSDSRQKRVALRASPTRGYILVWQLRLRIAVPSSEVSSSGGKGASSSCQEVVRRRDTILVSSGGGRMRLLVFKFRSEAECVAFSDAFVALNPPPSYDRVSYNDDRRHMSVMEQRHAAHEEVTPNQEQQGIETDLENNVPNQHNLISYVFRLLQDPDFVNLVDTLESCIKSSEDEGGSFLQAFTRQEGDGN